MPPAATRRPAHPSLPDAMSSDEQVSDDGDVDTADALINDEEDEDVRDLMQAVEGEDEDEEAQLDPAAVIPANPPPPPHSREISSLASWTVSSSKPGCGIAALRDPSSNLFWQSDGPQPHYLNIHFFKLVSIVGIRLYLDFGADESYTPTRIQFLAGMGRNDLVAFSIMELAQPRGWIEVDMSSVGLEETDLDSSNESEQEETEDSPRNGARKVPVLRAMLVQVRILENHQNGKDTHLRGLQIYARDKAKPIEAKKAKPPAPVVDESHLAIRSKQRKRLTQPEWSDVPSLR